MKTNRKFALIVSSLAIVMSLVFGATAAEASVRRFYGDDLAHRLAIRFNLDEKEVQKFLDQEYRRDHTDPKPVDTRSYDSGSNADHLNFIEQKLNKGVADRWITEQQKNALMTKLKDMMARQPSTATFLSMSEKEQRAHINAWQKEMRTWSRSNGHSLDIVKNITGKGNKYLMGIEY